MGQSNPETIADWDLISVNPGSSGLSLLRVPRGAGVAERFRSSLRKYEVPLGCRFLQGFYKGACKVPCKGVVQKFALRVKGAIRLCRALGSGLMDPGLSGS